MSEERPPVGNSPPEDDLRAVIAASLAESRTAEAAAAPDEGAAASETPSGGEGGTPPQPQPGDRPAPGSGEGDEAGTEPAKPGEGEPKPAEGDKPAAAAEDTTEAPTHWSADDKAQFNALPRGARGPFLNLYKRMEAGFTPKLQRGAQLEKDYGQLDNLVFNAPTRQYLAERGKTPMQQINEWAEIERGLLPAPPGASIEDQRLRFEVKNQIAARIIHNYGADPGRVAEILGELRGFAPTTSNDGGRSALPAPNGGTPPGAVDPALNQRLQMLETESAAQRQLRQRYEANEYARAGDQIATFANEKDAAGNLKHPFFAEPEIQAEMTRLAEFEQTHGRPPVLQKMYDTAISNHPTFHQQTLALQKDAEAKRVQEERRAKSEQAKRASSSITGAPGPGQTPSNPAEMSLRDQIKANLTGGGQTSGGPGRI